MLSDAGCSLATFNRNRNLNRSTFNVQPHPQRRQPWHSTRRFTTVDTKLDTFATLEALENRFTVTDAKLDMFATLEALENRFTSIVVKLDTFVTLQVLDTRLDGTDANFGSLEKKVEDMKTKLGVLNDLEANIRELANKVPSDKKLASSILITAIQALNGSSENGLLRNYQEVPFPAGAYPSRVDVRLNMAFPLFILKRLQVASRNVRGQFPLIRKIEDLVNIPLVTLQAYLEKYEVAVDGLSERSRQYELGRCVGINEQALRSRLGPP
ncbi:hypothetical protein CCMSSC00406_0008795 [Pleurotus cornucopiae]|uniref:Uncharacterized protein n=1 Tax=Pleurotus cornucopiae TaxID=5321 RepID=A0ACB7IIG1_PLECO|nr:hypothetical protein CCMSSC00406_0008795 [Pleurotus cornucopiae]